MNHMKGLVFLDLHLALRPNMAVCQPAFFISIILGSAKSDLY
jgi:hypothetical protein